MSLPSSMSDLVPCNRLLQKVYLAVCYRKKQMDVSFSHACPVIHRIMNFVMTLSML